MKPERLKVSWITPGLCSWAMAAELIHRFSHIVEIAALFVCVATASVQLTRANMNALL